MTITSERQTIIVAMMEREGYRIRVRSDGQLEMLPLELEPGVEENYDDRWAPGYVGIVTWEQLDKLVSELTTAPRLDS